MIVLHLGEAYASFGGEKDIVLPPENQSVGLAFT
jgi:hypothetical protein